MSQSPIPLPTPLRKFLLSGGDPREELGSRWKLFVDDIRFAAVQLTEPPDPTERLRKESVWRFEAEQTRHRRNDLVMADGSTIPDVDRGWTDADWREMTVLWSWTADLVAEPSIVEQLTPFVDVATAALIEQGATTT